MSYATWCHLLLIACFWIIQYYGSFLFGLSLLLFCSLQLIYKLFILMMLQCFIFTNPIFFFLLSVCMLSWWQVLNCFFLCFISNRLSNILSLNYVFKSVPFDDYLLQWALRCYCCFHLLHCRKYFSILLLLAIRLHFPSNISAI